MIMALLMPAFLFSLVDLAKFSYLVVDPEEGYSWVIFFYYKRLQWFLHYQ